MSEFTKQPLVRHRDETPTADWPFGLMQRIVTGGAGGVANVHVATVVGAVPRFFHTGYNEVYYVLAGTGSVELGGELYRLRPGSVVVIPAGVSHSLQADSAQPLEFVIFGTPPMPIDDERARPRPKEDYPKHHNQ
jgi:mannose-6-phosphate isomerase-like protein (cupin superfamily)